MVSVRVTKFVFAALGFLVGAAMLAGSISILIEDRDADDFFISDVQILEREASAIVSEDIGILMDVPGWVADLLLDPVDVRVQGSNDDGSAVFFGIAESADVEAYLAGVAYDEVTSIDLNGANIEYSSHAGADTPETPGTQDFWVASAEGPATQTLDWSLETGTYSVVVMNADGSAGIDSSIVLGAKISNAILISWIGLGLSVVLLLGCGWAMYSTLSRPKEAKIAVPAPAEAEPEED